MNSCTYFEYSISWKIIQLYAILISKGKARIGSSRHIKNIWCSFKEFNKIFMLLQPTNPTIDDRMYVVECWLLCLLRAIFQSFYFTFHFSFFYFTFFLILLTVYFALFYRDLPSKEATLYNSKKDKYWTYRHILGQALILYTNR